MSMNAHNTRTFHRRLYRGMLQKIRFLKRNDDLQQGTVTALWLYQIRQSMMYKTGEPIDGDMSSDHSCIWHIPKTEMQRVGIEYINAADRIQDKHDRYWQPESPQQIIVKMFENHVCVACVRCDPTPPGPY